MKYFQILLLSTSFLISNDFYYEYGKKIYIEKKINNKQVRSNLNSFQSYLTKEGTIISFKNEIIVKCKINKFCEDDFLDLKLNKFEKIGGDFYLIKLNKNDNIFKFSRILYKKEDIQTAKPNLKVDKVIK